MSVNPTALYIAFTVIDGLAVIFTLFRLLFRLQIQRLWWEDAWAAVVFACGVAFFISQSISSETADYETALISGWISSTTFTSTVWAVRMSLLCSTIRVISPSSRLFSLARVVALLFFLFWTTLIVLKIWWCMNNTKPMLVVGYGELRPVCLLPRLITLFKVTTDFISDAVLVILSLKLLWKIKLPRRQRRMILSLFSSSAVMSMFSLFHAICELVTEDIEYLASNLELAAALIVCNLLVVVTWMYRVMLRSPNGSLARPSEDDDFTTRVPARESTQVLTTVDLNTLDTTTEGTYISFTSSIPSSWQHSCSLTSGAHERPGNSTEAC